MSQRLIDLADRMMRERDEARARVEELEVRLGAATAEVDTSAQAMVNALNERKKAEDLAAACRRIVNAPTTTRTEVQSTLLNALQKFDGTQP
jgi:hypothetical protein